MNKKSKKVPERPNVIVKRGWDTGYPLFEIRRAVSMNGTLIFLSPVSDYNVKQFKEAAEALTEFADKWTAQKRASKARPKRKPVMKSESLTDETETSDRPATAQGIAPSLSAGAPRADE